MSKSTNPVKAIREYCLDCCAGQVNEVKLCTDDICPLHEWRFGKNPYRVKREVSEEQKTAFKERMAKKRAENKA